MPPASQKTTPAAPAVQVVIVDDSEDAAVSLTMLLELEGISAATAGDGESALQLVERTPPLLCLIDIGLPGMNGVELARRLRARPETRSITLIALTGQEAGLNGQAGTQVFDQYWTKPFDPKKMIVEIQGVIARAASGT
jgi:CheY-like chemotaxis protein